MSFYETPASPELDPGQQEPLIAVRPPGPQTRTWLTRSTRAAAPMGRKAPPAARFVKADVPANTIVYATAKGSNVIDVDGNRYVDLAAGFGAMLIGHAHPSVARVIELQAGRLLQSLGDVHPSDAKIALLERLSSLYPKSGARVILGQSGADAVSAALKTAALASGKPGVIAFEGAYHGLGYGPLAACGLRASYREPFSAQLNPHVEFLPFPRARTTLDWVLERARDLLKTGRFGAVLLEPILGRGGVIVPPPELLPELGAIAKGAGAVLIADEIWTGLGRAGKLLYSVSGELTPDLICLGKGLGGGMPISACIGSEDVMWSWRREQEVVHTSTFAGAPLACATALATLDTISRARLCERSAELGERFVSSLRRALADRAEVAEARGAGLMVGIDLGNRPNAASGLAAALLERGYIASTGGGAREVLVLTPPLTIAEHLLDGFVAKLSNALQALAFA